MNIVIASTHEFDPRIGGTERISVILAQNLMRYGHGVFFVAFNKSPFSKPYTAVVEQIILPNETDLCSEENIRCFSDFIKDKNIDVILNQDGVSHKSLSFCAAVKAKTNIKLFTAIHFDPACSIKAYKSDLSVLDMRSPFLRKIKYYLKQKISFKLKDTKKYFSSLYYRLYQECDAVILLSEHFKPAFKEISGLDDETKLEIITNPLTLPVPEKLYPKEKQILWVGRFNNYQKRPERLVQIWSYLEDRHPDWSVLFIGDGPSKPQVERLVRELGLKNIRFEGFSDPVSAYSKSSILCMTSTYEGFGLVLTEAMLYDVVPMAFGSYESVYEIIEDGVTGHIIEPFDLKMYAQRLESLMIDDDRRKIMSQNAREYVTDKFDVDKIIKKWLNLFDKYDPASIGHLPPPPPPPVISPLRPPSLLF